jgi:hypothetical protein
MTRIHAGDFSQHYRINITDKKTMFLASHGSVVAYIVHGPADGEILSRFMGQPTSADTGILSCFMGQPTSALSEEEVRNSFIFKLFTPLWN